MKKMKKNIGLLFLAFVGLVLGLAVITNVMADEWYEPDPQIEEMTVYANGNVVWYGYCTQMLPDWKCTTHQYAIPALERDEGMTLRVVFKSRVDLDKIEVKAWINGYRGEIEDKSAEFDVFAGNQYSKSLYLQMPHDIDAKDSYTLHVKIEDKTELSGIDEAKIDTTVQRITDELEILTIDLYSRDKTGFKFDAGTTLYVDVVVKNKGNHLAEDTYLKLSIGEVERTVYLGDMGSHDNQYQDTVKKTIALPLPNKEGSYKLEVKAYNKETSIAETRTVVLEAAPEKDATIQPDVTPTPTAEKVSVDWKIALMVIAVILAIVIIVLLAVMIAKQKSVGEKPATEESYY